MVFARHLRTSVPVAAMLVLAVFVLVARPTGACCTAFSAGDHVQIADQEILIVWDPATKTEHFIRRASFSTKVASFGFLVPTPTVPTLAEAPDTLFHALAEAIRPKEVHEERVELGWWIGSKAKFLFTGAVKSLDEGSVRVLHEQRVAGYDAVVLDADDPVALAWWLQEHGYDSRPALVEWLRPYVASKWKLTAFKLAAPEEREKRFAPSKETRYAVRMSFQTDRALFPFRTPSDQQGTNPDVGGGSLLRIYFVGPEKASGSFGGERWDAEVRYADRRTDLPYRLSGGVPEGDAPSSAWLTVFEDRRWPRAAGDDLYFDGDSDPTPVLPPPIVHYHDKIIPLEGVGAVALLGGVLIVRWRRRRRVPKT